jgi:hypothetical protein
MVLTQKQIKFKKNIIDEYLWLLNSILGETLEKIATYLRRFGIHYGVISEYLKSPEKLPGSKYRGLKQIIEKSLRDVISDHYFEIQGENLPVKLVYEIIFKKLCPEDLN